MDVTAKVARPADARPVERPSAGASRARRPARILAISATAILAFAGWKVYPRVAYEIRVQRASRAIDDGRLEEARGRLDLLIAERPDRPIPWLLSARLEREDGQITESEEALQRAIELGLPIERARAERDRRIGPGQTAATEGRRTNR